MSTQSAHADSTSPLFDSLVTRLHSERNRPATPFTTSTRFVSPSTAPLWMRKVDAAPVAAPAAAPAAPAAPVTPRRRDVHTALPSISTMIAEPITTSQLTPDERELIAEMGGTVAKLLLQMMHDDAKATR